MEVILLNLLWENICPSICPMSSPGGKSDQHTPHPFPGTLCPKKSFIFWILFQKTYPSPTVNPLVLSSSSWTTLMTKMRATTLNMVTMVNRIFFLLVSNLCSVTSFMWSTVSMSILAVCLMTNLPGVFCLDRFSEGWASRTMREWWMISVNVYPGNISPDAVLWEFYVSF